MPVAVTTTSAAIVVVRRSRARRIMECPQERRGGNRYAARPVEDHQVIDLDGHVFEPDSLWDEHLHPAYKRRRPQLRIDDRGTTRYEIDGRLIPPGTGRGAWAPEGIMEATTHRDGGIDPKARLADMDAEGIESAVLYGAASLGFYALDDADSRWQSAARTTTGSPTTAPPTPTASRARRCSRSRSRGRG